MTDSTGLTVPAQPSQQGAMALTSDDQLAFIADAVRSFDGVMRLAKLIASMQSCPDHLRGKDADCFRVTVQAVKWRMDPFAVAECTSLVHGRLCYEGKLIAAVLRSMNAIDGRLSYEITGEGQSASIIVTGRQRGVEKPVSIRGSVKEWRTIGKDKNGNRMDNQWDKQPEVQLVYRGTRVWARVHAPEAILGIYTPDEMEDVREVDVMQVRTEPEPARTAIADPPASSDEQPQPAAPPRTVRHPSFGAARALMKEIDKAKPDAGCAIVVRLCRLRGAEAPASLAADQLDLFGKDIAALTGLALPEIEDRLATWEQTMADGAKTGGAQ